MKKPLILVDGSSFLYRAFYAMPNLTTSSGEPTGAVYGIINMVRRLIKDYDPEFMAIIFDASGKTFRHQLYSQYKATRPSMPPELKQQVSKVHQIIEAMGLPLIMVEGVEADDVIATYACEASAQKQTTLVATGDKDLAQVVDRQVSLVDTMKDQTLDSDGVLNKFGVAPEQIIDYLALMGDSSDNVPGIPKVGPKTAVKWLQKYGSLDAIIERCDEIGGKVGENLRTNLEQLELARELVTVKSDLVLEKKIDQLGIVPADQVALRELYSVLEFSGWLAELDDGDNAIADITDKDYRSILTEHELESLLVQIRAAELVAFDTETTSLNAIEAELVGMSFSTEPNQAFYLPLAHDYDGVPAQLDRNAVLAQLKPWLEDANSAKLGQNLKYDSLVLKNYDINLAGIQYDTMLESYVLDSVASRHDMDTLALKYLGHKTTSFEDVAGKGKNQLTFNQIELQQAAPYAAEDADISLRLHQHLYPKLTQLDSQQSVFEQIEMPLVPVLARVEHNGVKIDGAMLAQQSKLLGKRIVKLESEAHALAGEEFNIASPKQIQQILFEKLGLPVIKKTPKGQPSTAESVLQELAADYELPQLILDHRGMSKLKSTYTDKLPEMVCERTGRVHTSYHQAVAATGRLSSSRPNLQNIPVRSEEGRRIRQAFIAEPGNVLVSADYSQIELRIMAHLSQDKSLLNAFEQGLDVHRATANEVFGSDDDEHRRSAKAINFGLIYGMSAFGLARQLKIGRHQAQDYIDLYFARYPGVKRYMDQTRELAHAQGYIETVFGRRLYLPEIKSSNHARRQYAERTAINAPMQGTAADLIKMAMIVINDWLVKQGDQDRMIMQVHDELVFEVAQDRAEALATKMRELMERVSKLSVNCVVDVGIADNWSDAH